MLARGQIKTFATAPAKPKTRQIVDPVPAETLRVHAPAESRLKVLGYAFVDEIATWPNSDTGRHKPQKEGAKFLVIAASLPFGRMRIKEAEYQLKLERKKKDSDETEPLKFSTALIAPGSFALRSGAAQNRTAEYVGRMAMSESQGFDFMKKGVTLVENMTLTPHFDDREHVYLAWEVPADFSVHGLQLRFENDEYVGVPDLALSVFVPGKPHSPGVRTFRAEEGGSRLRMQTTRSPGP